MFTLDFVIFISEFGYLMFFWGVGVQNVDIFFFFFFSECEYFMVFTMFFLFFWLCFQFYDNDGLTIDTQHPTCRENKILKCLCLLSEGVIYFPVKIN